MSEIAVHIEHLVLHHPGVETIDGQRFAQMTALALQSLLEQRGVPEGFVDGDTAEIAAPGVSPTLSGHPEQMAQELALALYRVLGRTR